LTLATRASTAATRASSNADDADASFDRSRAGARSEDMTTRRGLARDDSEVERFFFLARRDADAAEIGDDARCGRARARGRASSALH